MSTLYYNPNTNNYKVFCKGASEIILSLCTKILTRRGPNVLIKLIAESLKDQKLMYLKDFLIILCFLLNCQGFTLIV